jgi:predicted MFS family arabinose efflux permease
MLMTGSLGMLSSTVPVQWLLPSLGWRGLFWSVAGLMLLAMVLIALLVPADGASPAGPRAGQAAPAPGGYGAVFRHPIFVRLLPMGFFHYGGLVAMQTLWAGPWLTEVAGEPPADAAKGLFVVNLSMLGAFLGWGLAMPRLIRRGWPAMRIIQWGVPASVAVLAAIALLGPKATAVHWAAWCVSCTVVSLAQPAVAQAFVPAQAGRALSAFNLVIFLGVFCTQWAVGGVIDLLAGAGWPRVSAYRAAVALLAGCCGLSYLWFWRFGRAQHRLAAGYPST